MEPEKEQTEGPDEIEDINTKAIKRWKYYALGEERSEEGQAAHLDKEEEMYFREDEQTEQEDEMHVELCTI